MSVAKRARVSGKAGDILVELRSIKEKSPDLYFRRLSNHVLNLPAHPTHNDGWWCAHPKLMRKLLTYLAEQPTASEHVDHWSHFRQCVARQLAVCRVCARQYHAGVAQWELYITEKGPRKVAAKRIRALVAWDVERLHPALSRSPLLSKRRNGSAQTKASVLEAERLCEEALLECLLSFRVCTNATISETLGQLLKRGTISRTAEVMKSFLTELGAIPSGLMALCFHPTYAVRSWARRIIHDSPFPNKTDLNARHYLLTKASRLLPDPMSSHEPGNSKTPVSSESRKVAWDGFCAIFLHLDRKQIRSFAQTVHEGQLFETFVKALNDPEETIAGGAAECAIAMLKEMDFDELFVSGSMSPEGALNIIFQSLRYCGNEPVANMRLLHLIAPILSKTQGALTKQATSRLFCKCFDFLHDVIIPGTETRLRNKISSAHDEARAELDQHRAVLKTASSLLNWYYSHSAPFLPFDNPKKLTMFVVKVLREDLGNAWGWDLLRTVLLTDVFNLIRWMRNTDDAEQIGSTFLLKRPESFSLRAEEQSIVKKVITVKNPKRGVQTWVGPLWEAIREGRHAKRDIMDESNRVPSQEVIILLDLHRLIGMVDPACIEGEKSGSSLDSEGGESELKVVCERVKVIQQTIGIRFFEACMSTGDQPWWDHLPFHATHLLASANKEVAKETFEAMRKFKKLMGASCIGSRSKLLATVLKNDPDGGSVMADGCVSAMRIISALGSSISVRTFASFLLWYRILVDSKYVALLEWENSRWVLGVILTFLRRWKSFQQTTDRVMFSEVCCRFLSNLREVFKPLVISDNDASDIDNAEQSEARQSMLNSILRELLGMDTLRGLMPRGSWVTTVCSLVSFWKDIDEFREKMVLIIQYHEAQRKQLSLDQCRNLASIANLTEVTKTLDRWTKDNEKDEREGGVRQRKLVDTKIDGFFSRRNVSEDGKIPGQLVERRTPGSIFIGKSFAMKERTRRILSPYDLSKTRGPLTAIDELRKVVRDSRKDGRRLARSQSNRHVAAPVSGGKTKFELLVEQRQAEKIKKNAQRDLGGDQTRAVICDSKGALEVSLKGQRGKRVRNGSASEDSCEEVEIEKFVLPSRRRWMHPRMKETLYRKLLLKRARGSVYGDSCSSMESFTKTPDRFEDVESYVTHWEPIIVTEFRASLETLMKEEETVAVSEQSRGEYVRCRAAFEVEGPLESVGYLQKVSLRYCNQKGHASGFREGGTIDSQFDVTKVQMSDLVLLHIPPSKYAKEIQSSLETTAALGHVAKITRGGGEFRLNVNVAFEHVDTAPGKGRQILVSRLTTLCNFDRQLDGLYGLPDLSDGVLWNILEPRRGVEINKCLVEGQYNTLESDTPTRLSFVRRLQSKSILNESQSTAVKQVVQACAPIFRSRLRNHAFSHDLGAHGSMTLIQGPPGTGKTSTIIALLSAVLYLGGEERPWRRSRVHLEEESLVMALAPVRVLVCAPSNAAVDELMLRIMNTGLYTSSGSRASPRMVRVGGGTTNDDIRKLELRALAKGHLRDSNMGSESASSKRISDLLAEMSLLSSKIGVLDKERKDYSATILVRKQEGESDDATNQDKQRKYQEMTDKLSGLHTRKREVGTMLSSARESRRNEESIRKRENVKIMSRILNSSSLVFATLSSAGHEALQKFGAKADIVVVDEAAQCGEPEILIPLTRAQKIRTKVTASYMVLVGDPKQLPATVISTNKTVTRALGRSLFERVAESSQVGAHMLNTQYRMHPQIASFPNSHFYGGQLLNGSNVMSKEMHRSFHRDPQHRFGPLSFLDTSMSNAREIRDSGGSLHNYHEAKVIVCAITTLLRAYGTASLEGQIVVLSPYRQQVSTLKKMVEKSPVLRAAALEISTIDGIQGREKSIVFLSAVRSGQSRSIGFVGDDRRLNVALTRAKHSLIVVGNATTLERHSELWTSFLSHCRSRSRVSVLPANPEVHFPESRSGAKVKRAPELPAIAELPDLDTDNVITAKTRKTANRIMLRSQPLEIGAINTSPEKVSSAAPRAGTLDAPQRVSDGELSTERRDTDSLDIRIGANTTHLGPRIVAGVDTKPDVDSEEALRVPMLIENQVDAQCEHSKTGNATERSPARIALTMETDRGVRQKRNRDPTGPPAANPPSKRRKPFLEPFQKSKSPRQPTARPDNERKHLGSSLDSRRTGLISKPLLKPEALRQSPEMTTRTTPVMQPSGAVIQARNSRRTSAPFSGEKLPAVRIPGSHPTGTPIEKAGHINPISRCGIAASPTPTVPRKHVLQRLGPAPDGRHIGIASRLSSKGTAVSGRHTGGIAGRARLPPKNQPKDEERRLLAQHRKRKRVPSGCTERPERSGNIHVSSGIERSKAREPPAFPFSLAHAQNQMKRTHEMAQRGTGSCDQQKGAR